MSSIPIALSFERSLYIGNALGYILYGISIRLHVGASVFINHLLGLQLYMAWHSIILLKEIRGPTHRRIRNGYISYTISMVILMAFALAANALMGQLMWIEHRNDPGGPMQYYTEKSTVWFNVLGSVTDIFADFMSNALLVRYSSRE